MLQFQTGVIQHDGKQYVLSSVKEGKMGKSFRGDGPIMVRLKHLPASFHPSHDYVRSGELLRNVSLLSEQNRTWSLFQFKHVYTAHRSQQNIDTRDNI